MTDLPSSKSFPSGGTVSPNSSSIASDPIYRSSMYDSGFGAFSSILVNFH